MDEQTTQDDAPNVRELLERMADYEDTLRALARMDAKTREGEAVKRVAHRALERHGRAPF